MECLKVQELLSAYIDHECTNEEMIEISEHLKDCSVCEKEYIGLKNLLGKLNQLEEVDVPEGFHTDLMGRIKEEKKKKKLNPRTYVKYLSGFVAVFAMVLIFVVISDLGMMKYSKEDTGKMLDATEETRMVDENADKAEEESFGEKKAYGIEEGAMDNATYDFERNHEESEQGLVNNEDIEKHAQTKEYNSIDEMKEISKEVAKEEDNKEVDVNFSDKIELTPADQEDDRNSIVITMDENNSDISGEGIRKEEIKGNGDKEFTAAPIPLFRVVFIIVIISLFLGVGFISLLTVLLIKKRKK